MLISCVGNVLAMAGYEEYLAIVYHSATPFFGNQTLRFKIFDGNNNFKEIIDGSVPLSPFAKLKSFSFSEGNKKNFYIRWCSINIRFRIYFKRIQFWLF